jgi:myo-inositol 2-dehydrogenase/D-chiro-inositol 1-dehydrogenase
MFYEELILCGDEGRLKTFENENFLRDGGPHTGMEILRGENHPARISTPAYAVNIQTAGHSGGTYFEHLNFVNNIEGKPTNTATVEEGFWSVVVGAAAEESVKTGAPVLIEDLLKAAGVA